MLANTIDREAYITAKSFRIHYSGLLNRPCGHNRGGQNEFCSRLHQIGSCFVKILPPPLRESDPEDEIMVFPVAQID
jgi:hypothetical protein